MRIPGSAAPGTAFLGRTLLILAATSPAVLVGCYDAPPDDGSSTSPVQLLAGVTADGFQRATEPRPFEFPEDHGAHPRFRTEWWYVTGNVRDPDGGAYGFQFTVFRSALTPEPPTTESPWSSNQAYMAHLALTDSVSGTHRSFERFARGAVGLAGAQAEPFRVWLENWELRAASPGAIPPLHLRASDQGIELDLLLEPGKPLVLHGDRGLSAKSGDFGNASYYYSFPRLGVSGTLDAGDGPRGVTGTAWMDREWSTSVLSPDQTGWDWWSVQLDDGRDLMLFRLRATREGAETIDGTMVNPDGSARPLDLAGADLEELRVWRSPDGRTAYPVEWRIRVPREDLDLRITPVLDDQEVQHAFRYWEGAIRVTSPGTQPAVRGVGYLEMTGYEQPPPG